MVRARNLEKFHKNFKDLWSYIRQVLKGDKKMTDLLTRVHQKHRTMDQEQYLEYTLNNLTPYIDYIAQKDEFIFTSEFGNKPLNFLIGLDFRTIWNKFTPENKRVVFRYLEFLYIQASLALRVNKETCNAIVESITVEQELEKEAQDNPNMFGDNAGGSMDFQSLFGDDNLLMDLANDIKEELDFEQLLGNLGGFKLKPGQNPMDLINSMSNNPELTNMMTNLATKISQKMTDKNISSEDLQKSAEKLKENLANSVSNMPGGSQLKKMIKNLDFNKMAEQMNNSNSDSPLDDNQGSIPNPQDLLQQLFPQSGGNVPPELKQFMDQMNQNMEQTLEQNTGQNTDTEKNTDTEQEIQIDVD